MVNQYIEQCCATIYVGRLSALDRETRRLIELLTISGTLFFVLAVLAGDKVDIGNCTDYCTLQS